MQDAAPYLERGEVRFFFLCVVFFGNGFSEEVDLSRYEKGIFSQNGEDGILAKIFGLIGTESNYCVEFGAGDGVAASNTYFFRTQGWNCLLLDRSFEIPEYNLQKEFISKENINELFYKYEVPFDLDLLSIDIDYNDFYVWMALDPKFEAKVVVIECNGTHLPDEDKVVQYRRLYEWDGTNYFGASIRALYNLGRAKGYSLVYQESTGANLFFIKDTVLQEKNLKFKNMNEVEKIYNGPKYGGGPNGGHPADLKNRKYTSSQEQLK